MSTTELTPLPARRTEPTGRSLQLQASVLDAWRAQQGPEQLRLIGRSQPKLLQGWGPARRNYGGAGFGRTTADWVALSTSADAELYTSLRALRNRTRQLIRDNEHAKNAQRLIVNNVVGPRGIGLQAQVRQRRGGKLDDAVNAKIEAAWAHWGRAKRCHVAGKLSWTQMQRAVMGAVAGDGEVLLRKVKRRFADSRVPFALELIEADQLVENWTGRAPGTGNEVRMGVEVDEWQRPVAYWLYPRHPGDNMVQGVPQSNDYQRVPAEEIIHVAVFDRPGQTRGVPWYHSAMVKLRHIGGTEEAEIVRARASAAVIGFIQSPEADLPDDDADSGADDVVDGERVWDMAPGTIRELQPGESFSGFNPSTANAALDPFLRYMLRSVAAGIGVSYESLSRDYSQSNYSSSRLALLDDRDNWRALQDWLIDLLHTEVFEAWLEMAVLSGELALPAYETVPHVYQEVRWRARGWDWVDPAKEVAAAKAAVRAGFTTNTAVAAAKGEDFRDIAEELATERELLEELDLMVDTDPSKTNDKGAAQAPAQAEPTPASAGAGTPAEPDDDDSAANAAAED